MFSVKITGDKNIDKFLGDLNAKLTNKIILKGLQEAAKPLIKEAKLINRDRTKALERSIGYENLKDKNGNVAIVVKPRRKGGKAGWRAHFEEYGTVNQAPSPFMRPAWEKTKDLVKGLIKGSIINAIEPVIKKNKK